MSVAGGLTAVVSGALIGGVAMTGAGADSTVVGGGATWTGVGAGFAMAGAVAEPE